VGLLPSTVKRRLDSTDGNNLEKGLATIGIRVIMVIMVISRAIVRPEEVIRIIRVSRVIGVIRVIRMIRVIGLLGS
jgi:hypothetical protein